MSITTVTYIHTHTQVLLETREPRIMSVWTTSYNRALTCAHARTFVTSTVAWVQNDTKLLFTAEFPVSLQFHYNTSLPRTLVHWTYQQLPPTRTHSRSQAAWFQQTVQEWRWTANKKSRNYLLELLQLHKPRYMSRMLAQHFYWSHCVHTCRPLHSMSPTSLYSKRTANYLHSRQEVHVCNDYKPSCMVCL